MLKAVNLEPNVLAMCEDWVRENCDAVVLWAPRWIKVQSAPGVNVLADTDWERFAGEVQAVHRLKKQCYVACTSETPPWAYRRQAEGRPPPVGRPWWLAPDDVRASSPWADYVRAVLLYSGPRVSGVCPINEPNVGYLDSAPASKTVARMIVSLAEIWRRQRSASRLLVPATWSGPGAVQFTSEVLRELDKDPIWGRGLHVGWAHHTYHDVETNSISEVKRVLALSGRRRLPLYLTEGGLQFRTRQSTNPDYHADPATWDYVDRQADERAQLAGVSRHVAWCRKHGVSMWAQYEYQDSMWGGWASGLVGRDGVPHPLYSAWKSL